MRPLGRWLLLAVGLPSACPLASSCGDVHSDLIVASSAGANCARDSDCPGDKPHCDPDAQRCVQCSRRADCGSGQSCTLPAGVCVESCTASTACPASVPVCDLDSGLCRGCTADGECSGSARFCELASGRCFECRSSDDCGNFELPYCDRSGRCVECTEDGHCEEDGETCSTVLGECAVPCPDGTGCPGDDPICDLSIGFCVECTQNADCGPGLICRSSDCRRPPGNYD